MRRLQSYSEYINHTQAYHRVGRASSPEKKTAMPLMTWVGHDLCPLKLILKLN